MTARIALAHLYERPDYYDLLEIVEEFPSKQKIIIGLSMAIFIIVIILILRYYLMPRIKFNKINN